MAYNAPFATAQVDNPPWYHEKSHWRVSDRFGRTLSDIMLDGGGYHQGYLNYNSAKETPARIARRLSQQKLGLTGRFQLEDFSRPASRRGAPLCLVESQTPQKPQTPPRTAPSGALASTSRSLLRASMSPAGSKQVEDSFQRVFRDRDRRHMEWNLKAEYSKDDGGLTRAVGFDQSGPAHPFSALWDGPSTNWARLTRGNTLPSFRPMTVPGI